MNYIKLGGALEVSRIGLGAIGMSAHLHRHSTGRHGSIRTIRRGLRPRCHPHRHGGDSRPVSRVRSWSAAPIKGRRHEVVVATKFGFISQPFPVSTAWTAHEESIRLAIEGSLQRTRNQLHRPGLPAPGRSGNARSKKRSARLPTSSRKARSPTIDLSEGLGRQHPPRPRRPPDHCLAVSNTRCSPVTLNKRSCRSCASSSSGLSRTLAARSRPPDGSHPTGSTTSPPEQLRQRTNAALHR